MALHDRFRVRPFLLVVIVFLLGPAAVSATEPHELFGFLLEQNSAEFDHALGQPFKKEILPDRLTLRAYRIPGAKQTYLAVIFSQGRAVRLELTGPDYSGPTGFFGLTLGETAPAIKSVLGEPTETRHENDVNLDLWDYQLSNFSLEFTPEHKLYRIQVNEDRPRPSGLPVGGQEARTFALAVQSADIDTLIEMSSGSLMCTDTSEFGFTHAARTDFTDASGKLTGCLKKAAEAIVSLGEDMKGADDQIRIAENGGSFCVTKFPAASRLKEVVFTWEVNDWRVYEVTLRR